MLKIKGLNLISSKKFVKEKYGKDGLDKLIDALNAEDKKIVCNPALLVVTMVPVDTWIRFFEAGIRVLNNGDESFIIEAGKFNAERELGSVYRGMIKLASPEFLFKRAPFILGLYFQPDEDGIFAESKQLSPTSYSLKLGRFKPHQRLAELGILGWAQKNLEMAGAKNVKVTLNRSLTEGDGIFELVATWG